MIRKITRQEIPEGAGYFGEYGCVVGDAETVVIEGRAGLFLANRDLFLVDGFNIRPKSELLLMIGGLPETEAEELAREMEISVPCAQDILYLRTRSRWTEQLEMELRKLHELGTPPNIMDFGSTPETQASLYWNASKQARELAR